jgi:hypothetical protein
MDQEPITIDVKEAIRVSSLGRTFIYQKMSEGSFKSVKARGRRLIIYENFGENCNRLHHVVGGPPGPRKHSEGKRGEVALQAQF